MDSEAALIYACKNVHAHIEDNAVPLVWPVVSQ